MDSINYTSKDDSVLDFIVNPKKRVHRHLWVLLLLGILIFGNAMFIPKDMDKNIMYVVSGLYLSCIILLYVNLFVLVPKFLFNSKFGKYLLSVFLIIIIGFLMATFVVKHFSLNTEEVNRNGILNIFISFSVMFGSFIASSTAIKLLQRWIMANSRMHELEKNRMEAELEQLKNQITPHFLFNTLNNTNVLINTDPEKASQTVMMLNNLLRYQLYDSTREKIFLSSDIRFLTDFLNLEKIRHDRFEFTITTQGNTTDLLLPPLLFIPFVENAVKHSAGDKNGSYIHLGFMVKENVLTFQCVNSKPEKMKKKEEAGGLGLVNIRRRLDLLYAGNYELDIHETENNYQVNLIVRL